MMGSNPPFRFKIADEEWEFEQIHKLNYRTFVEEIPQHHANDDGVLIDKFHSENTYFICLKDDKLVGMMAFRDRRPFSLDQKLKNLDDYLPPGRSPCEVRLLAVDKEHRKGRVMVGLLRMLIEHGLKRGHNLALISGTEKQEKLYRHMGFVPFGPMVGEPGAQFQPMYITLEKVKEQGLLPSEEGGGALEPESFLPGPVAIHPDVRDVLGGPPVSHRSRSFMRSFQEIKESLCRLVGARKMEIFVGSGTLANDVVAGQISLLKGPGLILCNGEFGSRLIDHATRFGLAHRVLNKEWGGTFSREEIERALDKHPKTEWLWAVHCETSTTILNDLSMLRDICRRRAIKLCLDCISSVATVPVDLEDVYLASCASGKGLGSFPGLSMVFYNHEVRPAPTALPRYLDMGVYAANDGVPYTHSSNLVHALEAAVKVFNAKNVFDEMQRLSHWLRQTLRDMGFNLIGPDSRVSPAIVTIILPPEISSEKIGDRMEDAGYLLSYRSGYLLKRNWLQICLMGESSQARLRPVLEMLREMCFPAVSGDWKGKTVSIVGRGSELSEPRAASRGSSHK